MPTPALIPVVIAIGGNALYDKTTGNNLDPAKIQEVCAQIVEVVQAGYLPVLTFGNGPQVGNMLDMAETSARMFTTPVPLDVCVSWTQAEIGYWLSLELTRQFRALGLSLPIVALNTTVRVDARDPAFQKPSKPVGRFISPEEADELYTQRGWIIGPDANRGYRRMVPSPLPLEILEAEAIRALINQQTVVLSCGGGGIPVYTPHETGEAGSSAGCLQGIEAVIDKDYTSCLLAKTLNIPNLLICTEVDYVYLNYGTPQQKALTQVNLAEAERYITEGHFSAGSMGPKVAAMVNYLKAYKVGELPRRAMITSLGLMTEALQGKAGTAFITQTIARVK